MRQRGIAPASSPMRQRGITPACSPTRQRGIALASSPTRQRGIALASSPTRQRGIAPASSPGRRRGERPSLAAATGLPPPSHATPNGTALMQRAHAGPARTLTSASACRRTRTPAHRAAPSPATTAGASRKGVPGPPRPGRTRGNGRRSEPIAPRPRRCRQSTETALLCRRSGLPFSRCRAVRTPVYASSQSNHPFLPPPPSKSTPFRPPEGVSIGGCTYWLGIGGRWTNWPKS